MNRVRFLVCGVVFSSGWVVPAPSMGQNAANPGIPDISALPQPPGAGPRGTTSGAVATFSEQRVKPLTEGPLHEAFLSPRKDRNPAAPTRPLRRRSPNVRGSTHRAQALSGSRVTGIGMPAAATLSGSPEPGASPRPGASGSTATGSATTRAGIASPGFWSERKTDRLDYRKNGPPQDRPDEEPGQPPSTDCFYIPGQYYPDGDGVVWKKGYWTKVQPGWSWVPAQWIRQPDGWVFQDGYWDRVLEDRGTLFTPAEVDKSAAEPTISLINRTRRCPPRCTVNSTERSDGPTPTTMATRRLLRRHRPLLRLCLVWLS